MNDERVVVDSRYGQKEGSSECEREKQSQGKTELVCQLLSSEWEDVR